MIIVRGTLITTLCGAVTVQKKNQIRENRNIRIRGKENSMNMMIRIGDSSRKLKKGRGSRKRSTDRSRKHTKGRGSKKRGTDRISSNIGEF